MLYRLRQYYDNKLATGTGNLVALTKPQLKQLLDIIDTLERDLENARYDAMGEDL